MAQAKQEKEVGESVQEQEEVPIRADQVEQNATGIKVVPAQREKHDSAEMIEKTMMPAPKVVVEVETIRKGQEQQPMMAAIKAQVSKNILPKDKLMRIRVLEQAQSYNLSQPGRFTVQSEGDGKQRTPRARYAGGGAGSHTNSSPGRLQ